MISKDIITKYTQLGMLIVISLALIFWPYAKTLIPNLSIEQTLGFFVAIASGVFLYFDARLSEAIRGPTQAVTNMSLNDCFNYLSKHLKHIGNIRIFALSAGRIHPLFSSSDMHIGKCDILLRDYTDSELNISKNAGYHRHINDVVSEWEKEKNRGKINDLNIS